MPVSGAIQFPVSVGIHVSCQLSGLLIACTCTCLCVWVSISHAQGPMVTVICHTQTRLIDWIRREGRGTVSLLRMQWCHNRCASTVYYMKSCVGTECVCGMEESTGRFLGCPIVELGSVGSCSIRQYELHSTEGIQYTPSLTGCTTLTFCLCIYVLYVLVSPCVGGSIVPPHSIYCVKYQSCWQVGFYKRETAKLRERLPSEHNA